MKKGLQLLLNILLIVTANSAIYASEESSTEPERNNWGGKMIKSPFGIGLDLQTKYVWRGMEMMTEDSSPVLFPSLNYSYKGLYVYAMGGYAINGKYAEVDLGASYNLDNGLGIAFNDYYYPTVDRQEDEYLGGGRHTGHWLEAAISFTPEKLPFFAGLSNFFGGADRYINENGEERQAYSTYLELGAYYGFLAHNRLTFTMGAALNKSCYNGYAHGFSVCNLELKYTYNVTFKSGWTLPLNVAYIYNPVFDKSFVNFTANLAF